MRENIPSAGSVRSRFCKHILAACYLSTGALLVGWCLFLYALLPGLLGGIPLWYFIFVLAFAAWIPVVVYAGLTILLFVTYHIQKLAFSKAQLIALLVLTTAYLGGPLILYFKRRPPDLPLLVKAVTLSFFALQVYLAVCCVLEFNRQARHAKGGLTST